MLDGKEERKKERKTEKRKKERKKKKKEGKKIKQEEQNQNFVLDILDCEKSWDCGVIFCIRIAKDFHILGVKNFM